MINDNNNYLYINDNKLTLTNGNYNSCELCAELET